jgi:hypothetical protein
MKAERVPFFTGQIPPDRTIWLPMRAVEAVELLLDFKRDQTRGWHTIGLSVYEQVGCGCFVRFTYQPTAREQAELKEFLRDRLHENPA